MKQALVGTSKGLVILDRNPKWKIKEVHFSGLPVTMLFVDERSHTWWCGISHKHWGQKLHRSFNQGEDWEEVPTPKFVVDYSPGQLAKLNSIWVMEGAGPQDQNGLWLGTEPGALFYSGNNGKHFDLVESLWNHPSRQNKNKWFATGSKYPFFHSIQVHPENENHLYIAISCAGVFESNDKGRSWHAKNNGLVATYLPDPDIEIGHDPHLLVMNKKFPNVLWQQNHCGIFKTNNGGDEWDLVSSEHKLPHYGFPITIDHQDPEKAWVIPAHSDEQRIPKFLNLEVYHTSNGGEHWESKSNGLPSTFTFDLVLRHAFQKQQTTLMFGTTNGNVYVSENEGEQWELLTSNLVKINTIKLI